MEACSSHESFGAESRPSLAPPDLPTWCCLYAHAVSFGHLPLTPRGALTAKHISPMPPKRVGDVAPPPPEAKSLQATACAVRLAPGREADAVSPQLVTCAGSRATAASGRPPPSTEDPKFFFQDQKTPKLPVLALPTAAGALVPGQEPKWLEERWSRGTLCEDDAFKLRDSHKDKDYYPVYDDASSTASVASSTFVECQADPYEVHQLPGLRVYACLLGASTQPLKMKDVLASRAAFELLQKDSFSINLAELGAGTPVSVSDGHLKAVYQQLGGDVSNPGQPGADFRIFLLVLIGLARFGKTPAIMKIAGEDEPQRQARKRLTMAIRVLCDRDDRDLTQEELSLLILSLHLAAIDNSAKLQELVAKKVQILVSNRQDPEFAEGLTTQKFPRMAVHGAAELVFPSVHEIAALNLSFPDCFRSELGQELLVRVPRKAQFVKELPGSAAFLAQEMPEESDTGDTFPYLSKQELREHAGSDFFDPRKMIHSFEAQVKRALAVRKIREEKRRTRVWSPEEIRAVQEHMKNTQAGAFDETKGLDRTEPVPETPKLLESAAVTATFRRVEASMALKATDHAPADSELPEPKASPAPAPEIREDPPFPGLLTTHRKTKPASGPKKGDVSPARRHERPMARPKTAWRDEIWDRKMQFVILVLFLFLMAAVAIATASIPVKLVFEALLAVGMVVCLCRRFTRESARVDHPDTPTAGIGKPLICDAV
ncbi:unnamed protein product [Effrenium voratum]|uniref:Uncharacterized protein n=1 Tax=Effrenium voratum TaxID=2562239 RepID=A0AA36MUV5_9DINO|nr:unnamed protein product [Effrenium voratum]